MVQDLVTLIMAMSKCRECGKAVSTLAKTCPHCGVPKPVKKKTKVKKKTTNKIDLKPTEIQKNISRIALRQKEVELQTDAYNKAMENRTSIASNRSKSYREQSSQSSSPNKGVYDKFADGNLDLATAFWLFGILGSFAGSLILTLLAESVSKIFYFPFVGLNAFIIIALWECAENYKKEELQKKQSAVWGYLTQVFCVVGGLGLISTVYDIIKTL
tara:strand:- start:1091 stop:1735 length:645 start_codon:yes stop_codon:yes gene_type:complete